MYPASSLLPATPFYAIPDFPEVMRYWAHALSLCANSHLSELRRRQMDGWSVGRQKCLWSHIYLFISSQQTIHTQRTTCQTLIWFFPFFSRDSISLKLETKLLIIPSLSAGHHRLDLLNLVPTMKWQEHGTLSAVVSFINYELGSLRWGNVFSPGACTIIKLLKRFDPSQRTWSWKVVPSRCNGRIRYWTWQIDLLRKLLHPSIIEFHPRQTNETSQFIFLL